MGLYHRIILLIHAEKSLGSLKLIVIIQGDMLQLFPIPENLSAVSQGDHNMSRPESMCKAHTHLCRCRHLSMVCNLCASSCYKKSDCISVSPVCQPFVSQQSSISGNSYNSLFGVLQLIFLQLVVILSNSAELFCLASGDSVNVRIDFTEVACRYIGRLKHSCPDFPCEGQYLFGCLLCSVQPPSLDSERKYFLLDNFCMLSSGPGEREEIFVFPKQLRGIGNCLECWMVQPGGSFEQKMRLADSYKYWRTNITRLQRCAYPEGTVQCLLQLQKPLKAVRLRFSTAEGRSCPARTK